LLRDEVAAILVGIGTVLADDPSLTTRLPEGGGENPIRIILDSELRVPLDAKVVEVSDAKTLIVTQENAPADKMDLLREKGIEFIFVPKNETGLNLTALMEELYKKGITDVLLEGGSEVNASFLREGLIDKYLIYIAPKLLGGRNSLTPYTGMNVDTMDEAMDVSFSGVETFGEDIRITAYPK
jgi:diaminohydroxyphosphoribosylaminopyrimidine deaminase/5-amino-6-(5-phosphoribosylamino)uracil reductase